MTRWFVYELGKPTRQKPNQVILRSSLPRIHYYQNKQLQVNESQYLIPTYSWTLTPIPNWTYSVVTISHFQCTTPNTWLINRCADPSTRLITNLRKMLAAKFFSSSKWWRLRRCLVTKSYGAQTQQLLHKNDELGQILSPVTICLNKLFSKLVQLVNRLTAFKIIILYV